jgi:hypothetical protein
VRLKLFSANHLKLPRSASVAPTTGTPQRVPLCHLLYCEQPAPSLPSHKLQPVSAGPTPPFHNNLTCAVNDLPAATADEYAETTPRSWLGNLVGNTSAMLLPGQLEWLVGATLVHLNFAFAVARSRPAPHPHVYYPLRQRQAKPTRTHLVKMDYQYDVHDWLRSAERFSSS